MPSAGSTTERLVGADCLRLAALLSIVLFHVVLKDAQFPRNGSSSAAGLFDTLIPISTVFDNRSLAILSLFLLMIRHREARYGGVIAARARRLLIPYLAWTVIYPLLDLAIASATGGFHSYAVRLGDAGFWASSFLLATAKEHLHFLPTLFLLTLLYPAYRLKLGVPAAAVLLAAASAARVVIEWLAIGDAYDPTTETLVVLSAARIVEYLPLGVFAVALLEAPRFRNVAAGWITAAVIFGLLVASVGLRPAQIVGIAPDHGRLIWLIGQAVMGTAIMCLAAHLMLRGGGYRGRGGAASGHVGAAIEKRALAVFLIHPFFADFFDAAIGRPAFAAAMIVPKFIFVLACSVLSSSFMIRLRYLRVIA